MSDAAADPAARPFIDELVDPEHAKPEQAVKRRHRHGLSLERGCGLLPSGHGGRGPDEPHRENDLSTVDLELFICRSSSVKLAPGA